MSAEDADPGHGPDPASEQRGANDVRGSTIPILLHSELKPKPAQGSSEAKGKERIEDGGREAPRRLHHKADKERGRNKANPGSCFKCGEQGHKKSQCPAKGRKDRSGRKLDDLQELMERSEAKNHAAEEALKDTQRELRDLKEDKKAQKVAEQEMYKAEHNDRARRLAVGLIFKDKRYMPWWIYLITVMSLCLAARKAKTRLLSCLVGGLAWFFKCRIPIFTYQARVLRLGHEDPIDVRPDANSLQEVAHNDAIYATVEFSHWFFGIVPNVFKRVHRAKCSLEMFSQLSVPAIVDYDSPDRTVWDRIKQGTRTSHKTNIDRYAALEHGDVYNDTAMLTYVAYRDGRERRSDHPFPEAPRQ